jgi:hypothetical protein
MKTYVQLRSLTIFGHHNREGMYSVRNVVWSKKW